MVLVKWDAAGDAIWYHTWGGSLDDQGSAVWGDGTSIFTTGTTMNFGPGLQDMMLVKWTEILGTITHFSYPSVAWIILIAVVGLLALATIMLAIKLRRRSKGKERVTLYSRVGK
jgi:hypothetical protein